MITLNIIFSFAPIWAEWAGTCNCNAAKRVETRKCKLSPADTEFQVYFNLVQNLTSIPYLFMYCLMSIKLLMTGLQHIFFPDILLFV